MTHARTLHFKELAILTAVLGWLIFMMSPYAHAGDAKAERIITIGGSITEIVFALGEDDRLVGRDTTSTYPPVANALPDIGYIRALSPESALSVNPDMIIALEGYGPPEAAAVLRESGVPLAEIPEGYDGEAVLRKIRTVARVLGKEKEGEKLAATVENDLAKARERADTINNHKKVLFVMTITDGRIMVAGTNTHADGIVSMAGGINPVSSIEGYKPVTNEAIIKAAPDVILMMDRGGDHAASDEELFAHPAIALTPAGQNRAVIRMDGLYILGFGPRTAQAARELGEYLYAGSAASKTVEAN